LLLVAGLLLLAVATRRASACEQHAEAARWQRTLEVQGRRRSLLSFQARR
jgi:hypothetical protein